MDQDKNLYTIFFLKQTCIHSLKLFENLGENLDNDSLPVASSALVFMVVPLNANWKVPVAYYLTDGLPGFVLANLTRNVLSYLYDKDILVCALICDGCGSNQSMLANLGVPMTFPLLKSSFPHPNDTSLNVHVMLAQVGDLGKILPRSCKILQDLVRSW